MKDKLVIVLNNKERTYVDDKIMTNKLVIVLTTGRDDPEIASTAVAIAISALMFDKEVVIVLQGKAINLVRKNFLGKISFPPFDPLANLIATYQEEGGRIIACNPGIEGYHVSREDIIDKVEVAGGATFISEIEDAQVITY